MSLSLSIEKKLKYYFFGDIISQFGSGMSFIGLNWFLLMKTGMNEKVGLLMSIGILSGLIILPITGPIADRFNRKSILIYSNFVRASLIFVTLILLLTQPFHCYYVYFLAIVNGIGWNIYLTTARAFTQEIVSKKDLLKGNALMEISLQVGMFTAAATAGIVYECFGIHAILTIDIVTFIVSNMLLYRIEYRSALEHIKSESLAQKFLKGYKYLLTKPAYFVFGIILFLPFVATMTSNVVLPGYVSQYLKAGSVTFGIIDMCYGIGACLSGFIVMHFSKKYSKKSMLPLFFIISIISLIFMVFNKVIFLAYIATVLFGLPNSAIRVILNSVAMEIIDKEYMGRVMSIWSFISTLLQLISASLVGIMMDRTRPVFGFVYISAIMFVAFIGYLWFFLKFNKSSAECNVSIQSQLVEN